jgi:hypothetical protein
MKPTIRGFMQFVLLASITLFVTGNLQAQIVLQNPAAGAPGMMPGQMPMQPAPTIGPKQPGKIRIRLANPKVQMGQAGPAMPPGVDMGAPFRIMLMQYFTGPSVEIVPIMAMLPTQMDAEAKEKQCDYIFYSNLTQKKNGGGLGFLKAASAVAPMVPILGAAGAVAGIAATTAAAASASTVSSSVKAKNEVTLEYSLVVPGKDTPTLANALKAKAKQDGEDVITPLVTQAATAVFAQISPKK